MRPLVVLFVVSFHAATAWAQDHWGMMEWNRALQLPPGVLPDSLPAPASAGAHLVAKYCSQCHGVPSPGTHDATDWVSTVRRMLRRMEHSAGMGSMMGRHMMPLEMAGAEVPSLEQQQAILEYLEAHALESVPLADLPDPTALDARLFATTCAQCHALPAPTQHTAAEWATVVDRMLLHREDYGLAPLSPQQRGSIVSYLQRHATGS